MELQLSERGCKDWSESMRNYQKKISDLCKRYTYRTPEEPGQMPQEVMFENKIFTLISESHDATCEHPECQERFQVENILETGLFVTFYPILPIYTHKQEQEYCALCLGL
jgi:hypothetical protein